jgi:hypothetical protein
MTVTIDLKPETTAGLLALAHESGMSLEEYLITMVEGTVVSRSAKTLSPEERAAVWRETAKRFPDTPPLSDEAISRESMYADRG